MPSRCNYAVTEAEFQGSEALIPATQLVPDVSIDRAISGVQITTGIFDASVSLLVAVTTISAGSASSARVCCAENPCAPRMAPPQITRTKEPLIFLPRIHFFHATRLAACASVEGT
jgi:hypothetical protein